MKRALIALLLTLPLAACFEPSPQTQADQNAAAASDSAVNNEAHAYIPHNNVEFNNYNARQKIADDPTTILWCTSAFPIPNSPMFTVPIVGKLTSSGKRIANLSDPGPDGMTGTSSDYRYGFTPAGVYVDFYNLQTFCTTEPTVFQRSSTKIVLAIDGNLSSAQAAAQAALKAGHPDQAQQILLQALGQ
jgi:hypothetical protein